ncbi:MAG: hypothetical protein HUU45_11155 [Leptospiraceae bacterium]|nr:hypothetical protein [Leptospiraceae bacterium]
MVILITFLFLHCTDEKILTEKAFEKEKIGKKTEALYEYSLILKKYPNSPFVHKRLGILLAETPLSFGVAIYHLKIAKKTLLEDNEIKLKLFDLYLIVDEWKRAVEILDELRETIDEDTSVFLENLILCQKGDLKSKEFPTKFKTQNLPKDLSNTMNSFKLCKEKLGIKSVSEK